MASDGLRERLRERLLAALPKIPNECPDPQCGDSTWDHECQLGGEKPDAAGADRAVSAVAAWLHDLALEQWQWSETHAWPPSRQMALIRAMWLTDRADELATRSLDGEQTTEGADD